VLRSRSSQQALDTLETIRNALETTTVQHSGCDMSFTASIGVTQVCRLDDSFEPLVKRADLALYKAKETGRNRVEFHIGEER
ncbi:GGDEF domain-containing protein, partial [Vibrio parahaemolyticus]